MFAVIPLYNSLCVHPTLWCRLTSVLILFIYLFFILCQFSPTRYFCQWAAAGDESPSFVTGRHMLPNLSPPYSQSCVFKKAFKRAPCTFHSGICSEYILEKRRKSTMIWCQVDSLRGTCFVWLIQAGVMDLANKTATSLKSIIGYKWIQKQK